MGLLLMRLRDCLLSIMRDKARGLDVGKEYFFHLFLKSDCLFDT